MDLIIKPTEKCNFKCTFCSSTNITDDHSSLLDLKYIYRFLKRFPETNTIIVNGGDPLMVQPEYYWELTFRSQPTFGLFIKTLISGYPFLNTQEWV
jgi:L-lysine 2,3-aminomutase